MLEQNSSNKSIMLLILVLVLVLGYFYYSQFIQPTQLPIEPPPFSAMDDLIVFKDMTINFSILDDSRFKSLRIFGESPVRPGATGKRDLFAPF